MSDRRGGPLSGPPIPDTPGPRRATIPFIEVVRPTFERPVEATLVSLRWRGFSVHWVNDLHRLVPCPGAGCAFCPKIGAAWYAWSVAVAHGSRRLILVECTEGGWEYGPSDVCDLDSVVRGKGVRLRRKNKSKTAPVLISSIPADWGESQLPPAMDPKPLLLRLWGYTEAGSQGKTEGNNGVNGVGISM